MLVLCWCGRLVVRRLPRLRNPRVLAARPVRPAGAVLVWHRHLAPSGRLPRLRNPRVLALCCALSAGVMLVWAVVVVVGVKGWQLGLAVPRTTPSAALLCVRGFLAAAALKAGNTSFLSSAAAASPKRIAEQLRVLSQVPHPAPAAIPLQMYIDSCIYQYIAVVIMYIQLCSSIQMYALRRFRL